MLENNQEAETSAQEAPQPFDPNNAERIEELNLKFENPDAFRRVKMANSLEEMISVLSTAKSYEWSEGGSNRTTNAAELKAVLEEVSHLVTSDADEATILAAEDKIPDMGLLLKVRGIRSNSAWMKKAGDDPWA